MDPTEDDISARVLLRKVLHTELAKSPVTRSTTGVRRSIRIKNTPGLESPGSALRHRLKKKLHESTSMSPLPSPKRRRSAVAKPAPSPLYDEDMTTRGLLRGIIQMETDASLLMSGQPALQESEPNPAESSVSSAGERTEGLSGVELSDLTLNTEPLTHVVRGLRRRKPQRVFSVSAFEKQLDQLPDNTEEISHVSHRGDAPHEKPDTSQDLDFSAGSKSGLNLTLKTPFVDKRTERAGLQRKVSNRRLPSVDAFDEAVQRCLEQGPNQDHSVILEGKTLEDSSWQKLTLGLSDVTELYVQMKQDNTVGPSAEIDRDAESERDNQDYGVSEIPNVRNSRHLIHEEKDHEMGSPSQEDEEVVLSSQEAGDMFLSPEYDVVLAPTQAMTESVPESQDAELHLAVEESVHVAETQQEEVVEEVEHENMEVEDGSIEENPDAEHYRITRRAHCSEGEGVVLGIPAAMRVTKSFGTGLNPREKDLQGFVDGRRENLQDVPDEERPGSPASPPLYTEITTSEQRTQQHEASLAEDDVPAEDNDAPEEMNQSEQEEEEEEEEIIESDSHANKSHEPPQEEEEEEELIDSEPANQSLELGLEEEEEYVDDDDDDDDDALSAELSIKTPAFIKQKRVFANPTAPATPTVLKEVNAGPASQVAKRAPRQKRQTGANVLPKSYVMSVFKHFAKTKVASDVYPAINEILKKYFDRLADDLETYATHAKRKTIEVEDFELLMRRQGFVTDGTPVNILIEKYLPLEYRKLLIPVATSGNKVIPTQRS